MRSLLVLRRVAYLMQEPVYLFGDDVKDCFNHFVQAAEVLHLMNTIFIDNSNNIGAEGFTMAMAPSFLSTKGGWVLGYTRTPSWHMISAGL